MRTREVARSGKKLYNTIRGGFEVAWPLLSVVVIIVVLAASVGSGSKLDVSTWPAVQSIAHDYGNNPDYRVYMKMTNYYSIVSFAAAAFLFFNALSFEFGVLRISDVLSTSGIHNEWRRDLALRFRLFAVLPSFLWLIKLVTLDAKTLPINFDEYLVIATFSLCAVADTLVLAVLWKRKDRTLWSENREFFGALCYIDIPTIIGVWVIARYGPVLLTDSNAPEMMLRAISGGALIIHVVTSQIILFFLIAEVRSRELLDRHWRTVAIPR